MDVPINLKTNRNYPLMAALAIAMMLCAFPALAEAIEINDIDELQLIGNDPSYPLDGDYVLGNNIDASATATWDSGAGFIPIGDDTTPFTGTFDGAGYTLTNLAINRPTEDYVGLFGCTDGATIQNMALDKANVSGQNSVGGLVGNNYSGSIIMDSYISGVVSGTGNAIGGLVGGGGKMTNCYSTGAVTGNDSVGGLVGISGEITNCYSTSAVSGNDRVGGLVGNGGDITSCYSTGAVSGNDCVGGLVGLNGGNVMICYSMGAVTGSDYVGGLVGLNGRNVISCYSTGSVLGDTDVGGLVGKEYGASVICYWDMETSGQATSAGGTGKTTAEMMQQATFSDWDFTTVWGINENTSYPYLQIVKIQDRIGQIKGKTTR
jgi:hypothetical protein